MGKYWTRDLSGKKNPRYRPALIRFWEKVNKTQTCWLWTACKDSWGYGEFRYKGKNIKASRFSYQLHYGKIPKNKFVLHTCDNPSCVNPGHLWLGTQSDNMKDMAIKKRQLYKGEDNKNSKLTKVDIEKIRNLYKNTNLTKADIGRLFSISDVHAGRIINNKIWN